MTDKVIINNSQISAVDTVTTLYTSPTGGQGTIITAFTITNVITTGVSYQIYIADSTGVVSCPIVPFKIVARDNFDSPLGLINHVVPAGGTIRAENSTGNGICFYASGREQ